MWLFSVCLTLLWTLVHGGSLLPAVKPCRRSDPNINACLLQTGRGALPYFSEGDETRRINPIHPQRIERLEVQQGSGKNFFSIVVINATAYGWGDLNLTNAGIDLDKRQAFFNLHVPRMNCTWQYEMNGNVLIIPVTGKGTGVAHLYDAYLNVTLDFDVQKKAFKNEPPKDYIFIKNKKFGVYIGKADIKLANLFNGNKLLGDAFNDFLNTNFHEVLRDLGPSVDQSLHEFVDKGFASVQQYLPYDELFPE